MFELKAYVVPRPVKLITTALNLIIPDAALRVAYFGSGTVRRYNAGVATHTIAFRQGGDPNASTMKNLKPIIYFCNFDVKLMLNNVIV